MNASWRIGFERNGSPKFHITGLPFHPVSQPVNRDAFGKPHSTKGELEVL